MGHREIMTGVRSKRQGMDYFKNNCKNVFRSYEFNLVLIKKIVSQCCANWLPWKLNHYKNKVMLLPGFLNYCDTRILQILSSYPWIKVNPNGHEQLLANLWCWVICHRELIIGANITLLLFLFELFFLISISFSWSWVPKI